MRINKALMACVVIVLGVTGCQTQFGTGPNYELVISPFQLHFDSRTLTMSESGDLYGPDGTRLGKVTREGVIYDRNDVVIARLMSDGQLRDAGGKLLITVGENGEWSNQWGSPLYWSDEGELIKGDQELSLKLVPADSPARRVASVFVYMFFTPAAG